jgi:hypothetical protein
MRWPRISLHPGYAYCICFRITGDLAWGNPWDAPAWPEKGDQDVNQIYKAVGKTLSSWEMVEEVVARLFGLFTSTTYQYPQMAPAIRAYGSITSFGVRAKMVIEAGRCFFNQFPDERKCPLESNLQPFITECEQWAGRRNDVAHGRAEHLPSGYFLLPGLYHRQKQPLGEDPKYCYNSDQISKFSEAFEDLYDRVSEYALNLMAGFTH